MKTKYVLLYTLTKENKTQYFYTNNRESYTILTDAKLPDVLEEYELINILSLS